MHLIQGIHHVALKPQKEQFQKVMEFSIRGFWGLKLCGAGATRSTPAR